METFGQYAATRPLREHPLATSASTGGVLVQEGVIRTFIGVDLITGMPVIVYTMPGPAPRLPEVYSEHLPAVLERGQRDGTGYVILASAPGYAPLKPTLPEPRLHWLARSSARALADAHGAGLVHGHLRPEHFYAQGDHLFIEGFGLPWSDEPGPYRAPEGSGQAPADVYAWARCLNVFASNNAEAALDGELGHLIGHCLNSKARERPTAAELVLALEQILSPKAAVTAPIEADALEPSPGFARERLAVSLEPETVLTPAPPEPASHTELLIEPRLETAAPAPETTPTPAPVALTPSSAIPEAKSAVTSSFEAPPAARAGSHRKSNKKSRTKITPVTLESIDSPTPTPEADASTHTLPVPAGLEADEPDVIAPTVRVIGSSTTTDADSPPKRRDDDVLSTRVDDPRPQPSDDVPAAIRIGWQDDDSWRSVRAPTPVEPSSPPLLVWVIGGLLILCLLGGLIWFLTSATSEAPTTPTSPAIQTDRYVVNFRLDPSSGRGGRLTVIEAPASSGYAVGQVLSSVPGPVLFTSPGTYKLRVSVDGYESAETTLEVPGSDTVILKLQER